MGEGNSATNKETCWKVWAQDSFGPQLMPAWRTERSWTLGSSMSMDREEKVMAKLEADPAADSHMHLPVHFNAPQAARHLGSVSLPYQSVSHTGVGDSFIHLLSCPSVQHVPGSC